MADQAAAQAREMRNRTAASDEAARQNIERRQGITQKSGVQIDRKRVEYTPETQVGNIQISRGRQVTDREEMGAGAKDRNVGALARQQRLETQLNSARRPPQPAGGGAARAGLKAGGAASGPGLSSIAKKNPYVLAATTAAGALSGKLPSEQLKKMIGRGCVRSMWSSLWPTFGHTIYIIFTIFFLAWSSRFARKYLPQVGEEWIPPDMLEKIPKGVLVPLKLAEVVAISFILFWVLLFDLICLGVFAFFIAIIIAVAKSV